MRRIYKTFTKFILISSLVAVVGSAVYHPITAHATTIEGIKDQMNQHQSQLDNINDEILELEGEHDLVQEEIDDLNAEILNTLTSIGLKEDEIAAKEAEIVHKQAQIVETQAEYEAAKAREEEQRADMAACTRLVYESGSTSYLTALLGGKGFADILNRLDYIEKVYEYAKAKLLEYIDTKDQVQALWDRLEEEKAGLEADRLQLEADRSNLQIQKENLDTMLAVKRQESADFEAELAKARKAAEEAKKLIQQDQAKLKQLEAQLAAQQAANATYATTSYSAVIDAAEGSELGKQLARFGCQYIGNKYVYGGMSLTNGVDCSGFTYRVYEHFGYKLPRTSFLQRSAGTGISYDEAQPGDLICYDGHVGLYIGGGLIVHASNSKPYPSGGIKVSKAQYRTILAVRRIIE